MPAAKKLRAEDTEVLASMASRCADPLLFEARLLAIAELLDRRRWTPSN
ncbi:MAG: hypothetical protein Q8M09_10225 [Pseudomonadota bacterium]|nr:hypothetical protein [Pseudomonadota bacterium]MDP1904604.1 hypothetical protein [Pseudomonadota bacterium]MDP2353197.1 hypothetical protein [Pseudomonadota bacterium]